MGGNDIVAGKPSVRKSSTPAAGSLAFEHQDDQQKAGQRKRQPVFCGAMSQQRDDSGSQSVPQKLVQLVGCRDPKAGSSNTETSSAAPNPKAEPVKARLRR
jgi:hypothetical protein